MESGLSSLIFLGLLIAIFYFMLIRPQKKRAEQHRNLIDSVAVGDEIVTIGEGRTMLQRADLLARQVNMKAGKVLLQYEGLNPSGSFKDNGMTAAFTGASEGRRCSTTRFSFSSCCSS